MKELLSYLHMPPEVKALGPQCIEMKVKVYRAFWDTAKENTPCYPDDLSFFLYDESWSHQRNYIYRWLHTYKDSSEVWIFTIKMETLHWRYDS